VQFEHTTASLLLSVRFRRGSSAVPFLKSLLSQFGMGLSGGGFKGLTAQEAKG
jgi:hypothetical protein